MLYSTKVLNITTYYWSILLNCIPLYLLQLLYCSYNVNTIELLLRSKQLYYQNVFLKISKFHKIGELWNIKIWLFFFYPLILNV